MKTSLAILGLVFQIFGTHCLIIPDEIPSLLSVIYSNIPTIKKGTDSRVGWGFRLGDRADFQVLVEIGPQTNTQPLANQDSSSNSKRNVPNNLRNFLYAQQQDRKKHISNTEGGKWIDQWSQSMRNVQEAQPSPAQPKPGLGIGEVDAKSVIPDDSTLLLKELYGKKSVEALIQQSKPETSPKDEVGVESIVSGDPASLMLEKLYRKKTENQKEEAVVKSTTQRPKTTTSYKDALDNVDMDEMK